MYQSAQKIWSA